MTHPVPAAAPSRPGQAAFGAIAEIVGLLVADSTTDWTRVDIEALRQHLIDMEEVTMHAVVRQEAVTNGARFTVSGQGRTIAAIQRMARAHATTLTPADSLRMSVETSAAGAIVTVVATAPSPRMTARIRGLGFIGLLTLGDHHGPHHLAIARGQAGHSHR
ncbi:MAG: hypothetical protein HUU26_05180 [Gemmatimonadaceae bacterium]|nr:hypothetical protein [Gemmatimonadaceae bacterium]